MLWFLLLIVLSFIWVIESHFPYMPHYDIVSNFNGVKTIAWADEWSMLAISFVTRLRDIEKIL